MCQRVHHLARRPVRFLLFTRKELNFFFCCYCCTLYNKRFKSSTWSKWPTEFSVCRWNTEKNVQAIVRVCVYPQKISPGRPNTQFDMREEKKQIQKKKKTEKEISVAGRKMRPGDGKRVFFPSLLSQMVEGDVRLKLFLKLFSSFFFCYELVLQIQKTIFWFLCEPLIKPSHSHSQTSYHFTTLVSASPQDGSTAGCHGKEPIKFFVWHNINKLSEYCLLAWRLMAAMALGTTTTVRCSVCHRIMQYPGDPEFSTFRRLTCAAAAVLYELNNGEHTHTPNCQHYAYRKWISIEAFERILLLPILCVAGHICLSHIVR